MLNTAKCVEKVGRSKVGGGGKHLKLGSDFSSDHIFKLHKEILGLCF